MRGFVLSISFIVFLFVGQTFGTLQCSRPNEVQDCVKECPPENTCITKDIRFNCLDSNKRCQIKCVCKEGFYRNYDGDCVSGEACEINMTLISHEKYRSVRAAYQHKLKADVTCGPNEEYQECKKTCPPDTCISLVARFKCDINPPCVPGCVCKQNFLRANPHSRCMSMQKCPQLAHSPDYNS